MPMTRTLRAATIGTVSALLLTAAPLAMAAQAVHVQLQDPSSGNGVSVMRILASPAQVQPGRVTFDVQNDSKALVHEMLLLKRPAGGKLPYDAATQRVIEARTVKLVDTDDIKPGASVTETVSLKPGRYEIICNQPGHYMQGMKTPFTVAP